ncbi:hypothetical protein WJX74_010855 [Apatococcus lobatus]|uniref:Uncharacterized protein n=1 Tax=Apatococcus lobatus TaxID=904363 RepID=A0AAW1RNF9_9CHLO
MVLDLPEGSQGLSWIVGQGPLQLLLIPGLTAASIAAAAAGDRDALQCLRFAAQHSAALGSTQNVTALDKLCAEACSLEGPDDPDELKFFLRQSDRQQLRDICRARMESTTRLLDEAVAEGRLDSLKWLRALCQSFPRDTALMKSAAQHGHLKILQFLRSGPHPASWDEEVTASASPHADCLVWLLSQEPPCPFSPHIVTNIAETETLATLMTLRESAKLPSHLWDKSVCEAAAKAGNLAMLQYLRRQTPPVPWTSATARNQCNNVAASRERQALEELRPEGIYDNEHNLLRQAQAGSEFAQATFSVPVNQVFRFCASSRSVEGR